MGKRYFGLTVAFISLACILTVFLPQDTEAGWTSFFENGVWDVWPTDPGQGSEACWRSSGPGTTSMTCFGGDGICGDCHAAKAIPKGMTPDIVEKNHDAKYFPTAVYPFAEGQKIEYKTPVGNLLTVTREKGLLTVYLNKKKAMVMPKDGAILTTLRGHKGLWTLGRPYFGPF